MKSIKQIIIEGNDGSHREVSHGDIVSSLDHDKRYDFHLATESNKPLGEIHGVSPIDIALYVGGIEKTNDFHRRHRIEGDGREQDRYVVRIREAA